MDEQRFDDLVRHVATLPRRHVLRTLLGGLAVGLGLPAVTTANRKPNKQHGKRQGQKPHGKSDGKPDAQREARSESTRRVTAEGPCGNGSGKANRCEKDKDCCTRLCDQKRGRCRCKTLGEGCTDDRNCCATFGQPMTCQSGSCQTVSQEQALLASPRPPEASSPPPPDAPPPPPPPGPGCTPTTCAAQGKNCGSIADGCGHQIRCGPDSCGTNEVCLAQQCVACGRPDTPCCIGNTCAHSRLLCSDNGQCVPCGNPGALCCVGNPCGNPDLECSEGRCAACGHVLNQPCCPNGRCFDSYSVCSDGLCLRCGYPGEMCCEGNYCHGSACSNGWCPE